jgi:hypothetical protein
MTVEHIGKDILVAAYIGEKGKRDAHLNSVN